MGFFAKLGATIKERLDVKTIAAEAFETVTNRIIPQGAAELAQAIFTEGTGYVPYGPGQEPLPVEPADPGKPSPATAPSTQQQYQSNLAAFAGRSNPGQDQSPTL